MDEGIRWTARHLIGASAARQKTLLTDPTMAELREIRRALLVAAVVVNNAMIERVTNATIERHARQHGTPEMYYQGDCRCAECRAAAVTAVTERRRKA